MNHRFQFHMPTKIIFEPGAVKKLGEFIQEDNVLIISDPFLFQRGIAQEIGDSLAGKNVAYFSDIEPNPSCESVDAAAAAAREINAGCVIGLGGGSSMDVSKMTACLATNPGSIYDYYSGGTRVLSQRKTTLIAIPTTAGTGSEVTNVGVYTNKKTHVKMPMVNERFWPDLALVDPDMTYSLPPSVTASTGMDAFCHAIEAYWNKESQPMCDMIAMGALELILNHIRTAYESPADKTARAAMMKASLMAGVAFSQTRTTGIHAMSFPLTAEFGASHGIACSVTLPAFIRVSAEQAGDKMKRLANHLGFDTVDDLADAVEALLRDMKMPVRLHELGIRREDLAHIAQTGLSAAIIHLTPAEMNGRTVLALLESIL